MAEHSLSQWEETLHIDGLEQERSNSSVVAMELRLSCTNPSIYDEELNEVVVGLILKA